MPTTPAHILTINAGSSSIKFSVYEFGDGERELVCGQLDRIGLPDGNWKAKGEGGTVLADETQTFPDHGAAIQYLLRWLSDRNFAENVAGIGHRIVHGGPQHILPERIDDRLLDSLRAAVGLAPNHLPQHIRAIEEINCVWPHVPQVACFDTGFHRTMPAVARLYGLPRRLSEEGIVRYGFHGLSYEFLVSELTREGVPPGRWVLLHLGNGSSICAVKEGESIDTSMGFTPTAGLPMSTRCGDIDPEIVLYLEREKHMAEKDVATMLVKESGLQGVSGVSSDMRDLLARAGTNPAAAQAIDLYCYSARKYIGAYAAALGGLDLIVFTAGIGEHAAPVRARICDGLEFLGVRIDAARNDAHASDISAQDARVKVRVAATNEELMIARHTRTVIGG